MEKFAPKILEKTDHKWGIYRPQKNIAVGSRNCQKCSTGRPADRPADRPSNGQILPVASYRSTARSTQTNREQSALSRSTRTVDRLQEQPACTYPCTSVDPDGRPATWCGRLFGSTDLAWQSLFWSEKLRDLNIQ